MVSFINTPNDIINYILSFDNRFRISNGVPISIIPNDDIRYTMLKKVCRFSWKKLQSDDGNFAEIFTLSERSENIRKFNTICFIMFENKDTINILFEYNIAENGVPFQNKCISSSYTIT